MIDGMFNRGAIRNILDNPKAKYFGVVNDFLSLLTIVSILAIVLETVPEFSGYSFWFLLAEWAAVFFFGLEYLARAWSSKNPLAYIFSFFGVVDLVAILPSILGLGNLSFLKSARIIRIIRFLRLVRISKLAKAEIGNIEHTLGVFGFTIAMYGLAVIFVMLLLGVALHTLLPGGEYWSVPGGMFWAFLVFLGDMPVVIPPGVLGMVLFIVAKFLGMALFGLLIGVTGKIFNEILLGQVKKEEGSKKKKR
jgi:voltage-gated potassium channel